MLGVDGDTQGWKEMNGNNFRRDFIRDLLSSAIARLIALSDRREKLALFERAPASRLPAKW